MDYEPRRHPHLDHGYAFTSHSSQGQTAERVLIHVDTELAAKGLLNSRMAYVSVSRGQWDAQIFTNDREKLPLALGHDVSHQSALKPGAFKCINATSGGRQVTAARKGSGYEYGYEHRFGLLILTSRIDDSFTWEGNDGRRVTW
jgi:hypothetical protein